MGNTLHSFGPLGNSARAGSHDQASGASTAKLHELSDEVSRIASTLARLATQTGRRPSGEVANSAQGAPEAMLEAVRRSIRARRERARYFNPELFADPVWDMLLSLFAAELEQVRVSVTSLCSAAEVPATTALRWIATMTDANLLRRRPDPCDGRRVFIEMTPEASAAMRSYFGAWRNC